MLSTAGYGNARVPREFIPAEETALKAGLEQWRLYAAGRSGVGSTPREEVAMRMYKNREGLVLDAAKNCRAGVSSDAADKALRVCAPTQLTPHWMHARLMRQIAAVVYDGRI